MTENPVGVEDCPLLGIHEYVPVYREAHAEPFLAKCFIGLLRRNEQHS